MVTLRTLRPFRDLEGKVDREPGDTFEATEDRAAHIETVLPGYVERMEGDLSSLRLAELRKLADERGVKVPAKVTKAELLELLEG